MKAAYEEIIDFLAAGPAAERWLDYQASPSTRLRVETLLNAVKNGAATQEEQDELDHYVDLEHIVRLAKARARAHL